jgi:hypothetical protein
MTELPAGRVLILTIEANADVAQRGILLAQERGVDFAAVWLSSFSRWLRTLAHDTVILGTSHPFSDRARSFPYKKQATLLVEYTPTEMRIVRIYFAGQDWLA